MENELSHHPGALGSGVGNRPSADFKFSNSTRSSLSLSLLRMEVRGTEMRGPWPCLQEFPVWWEIHLQSARPVVGTLHGQRPCRHEED